MLRYPEKIAALVVHMPTQRYLRDHGLPDEHLLFKIHPPSEAAIQGLPDGTDLLCVGADQDTLDLCIDTMSGTVVEVHRTDGSVWHVNSGVPQFVQCLEEFSRRYPFGQSSNDLDTAETAANEFAAAIRRIDETALDMENGYWDSIIFDITNGDYAAP